MAKRSEERQDRYFMVHHYMAKTDAWRALSATARAIYIQIGLRFNGSNNGKISYSVRDAAGECNIAINTAHRALRELISLGFIEETRHGSLSRKTRIASEWRLTAYKCDLTGGFKTCTFMQRDAQARDHRYSRSRPQESVRLSQTTISQAPEPVSNDGRECLKRRSVGPKLSQTTISQSSDCLKRRSVKPVLGGSPVSNDGTHIIYHPMGVSGLDLQPPADDAPQTPPLPNGAPPSNAPSDRPVAKLVWTKPIVRELTGDEAIVRRAETLDQEQQK
jgi:hypothetical protein